MPVIHDTTGRTFPESIYSYLDRFVDWLYVTTMGMIINLNEECHILHKTNFLEVKPFFLISLALIWAFCPYLGFHLVSAAWRRILLNWICASLFLSICSDVYQFLRFIKMFTLIRSVYSYRSTTSCIHWKSEHSLPLPPALRNQFPSIIYEQSDPSSSSSSSNNKVVA